MLYEPQSHHKHPAQTHQSSSPLPKVNRGSIPNRAINHPPFQPFIPSNTHTQQHKVVKSKHIPLFFAFQKPQSAHSTSAKSISNIIFKNSPLYIHNQHPSLPSSIPISQFSHTTRYVHNPYTNLTPSFRPHVSLLKSTPTLLSH